MQKIEFEKIALYLPYKTKVTARIKAPINTFLDFCTFMRLDCMVSLLN